MKEIKTSENRLNKFDKFFFLQMTFTWWGHMENKIKIIKGGCVGCAILHERYKKKLQKQNRGYREQQQMAFWNTSKQLQTSSLHKRWGMVEPIWHFFFLPNFRSSRWTLIGTFYIIHYINSTRNKGMWWHQPHYRCWYLLTLTNY